MLRDSGSVPRRTLLLGAIVALALFVVGPQAGSFDDDGDGSPDIPVVVSSCSLADDVASPANVNQPWHVDDLVATSINAASVIGASSCVSSDERSGLRYCRVLRC